MIFVWGTKRVERTQGLVADFCPICREFRAFQLIRVGLASHVYYVAFGEGKLAGFIIRCCECGVDLSVQPTRYVSVEKNPHAELTTLIRVTFPKLHETYEARLELESQIKRTRSTLSGDQYQQFLMEPFTLLNPQVEARFARSSEMDKPASLGCLGTVLLVGLLFFGSLRFRGPTQDKILLATLIIGILGIVYTFVQMHLAPARFFRARILPPLIKSLQPLEPTRDELSGCIERCKTLGLKIGKIAKMEEIWPRLERRILGFD
jgi:hypothetical protein